MNEEEKTIYVYLLGEGVDVWRPVKAVHLRNDIYKITGTNHDTENERWQFTTGEVVGCQERVFSEGNTGLAACRSESIA